jgi:spore germination protein YaaH
MLELKKSTVIATMLGLIFTSILSFYLKLPEQAHRIVSPLSASMFGIQIKKKFGLPTNTFAFAPGWSVYNLNRIDYKNIDTLAFYDVPADNEVGINKDNDGYLTLQSDRFAELTQNAHSNGSKIVFTLSQTNNVIIASILTDTAIQSTIAQETASLISEKGIDGVTVNFEYDGDASIYQQRFTDFIRYLTQEVHKSSPQAQVSVAVPDNADRTSLFDITALTKASDSIFVVAYDYAVPERNGNTIVAPSHGYNQREYWEKVSNSIQHIVQASTPEKLSMETAWYGTGGNYPSYESDEPAPKISRHNTLHTPLSEKNNQWLTGWSSRSCPGCSKKKSSSYC